MSHPVRLIVLWAVFGLHGLGGRHFAAAQPPDERVDLVFFVDCGAGGKIQQVEIVNVDDVPNEYLPRPGLILDPIKNCDEGSFVIMLDGGWVGQDLFRFENTFRNCYDFLYGYKEWRFAGLPSVPCRGGYSAMHVNAWLRKQIPHAESIANAICSLFVAGVYAV